MSVALHRRYADGFNYVYTTKCAKLGVEFILYLYGWKCEDLSLVEISKINFFFIIFITWTKSPHLICHLTSDKERHSCQPNWYWRGYFCLCRVWFLRIQDGNLTYFGWIIINFIFTMLISIIIIYYYKHCCSKEKIYYNR